MIIYTNIKEMSSQTKRLIYSVLGFIFIQMVINFIGYQVMELIYSDFDLISTRWNIIATLMTTIIFTPFFMIDRSHPVLRFSPIYILVIISALIVFWDINVKNSETTSALPEDPIFILYLFYSSIQSLFELVIINISDIENDILRGITFDLFYVFICPACLWGLFRISEILLRRIPDRKEIK